MFRHFSRSSVFVLLCISFMRVDVTALREYLRQPGIVLAATAWTMLAVPLIIGISCLATGLDERSPELFLALMLQAVASPMMAAPALATLMGLDSTLVLITLVTSTALVPLTAPLFTYAFLGSTLTLSPLALGLKLFAILGGSLLVAAATRWIVGASAIKRHKEAIDGFTELHASVDGQAIPGLFAHREAHPAQFPLTLGPDNIFGVAPGAFNVHRISIFFGFVLYDHSSLSRERRSCLSRCAFSIGLNIYRFRVALQ